MRVLKWIVDRTHGRAPADETPLGWVPSPEAFDLGELSSDTVEKVRRAQSIDLDEWKKEIILQDELFLKLYSHLPKELIFQRELLISRL
jgi:phosphoenolpyruvate carboxykinase (GTP)